MGYEKVSGIPAEASEQVVRLDSGELVAVSCNLDRVASGVSFHAKARAINSDGSAVLDAKGDPVVTQFIHSAPIAIVDAQGSTVIAKDCMMAVLGEPTVTPWADVLLSSASIRVSLAAAPISGPVDAGAAL